MATDSTRRPRSGPIPILETDDDEPERDELEKLEEEATRLKAGLDDVTARLARAIAGQVPRRPIEALEGTTSGFRSQRVLVIEDHREEREFLTRLVERLGHTVVAADNGLDGLVAVQEFRPHIAFIDLELPGLDGYSLARRIRANLGAKCPLLIAYTAYAGGAIRAAATTAGFDRHIVKPISMDELMKLLQPAADARR